MTVEIDKDLVALHRAVLSMGAVARERVSQAFRSLLDHDVALATIVREGDREIDEMELDIDEECLKILALHQPVAADLRFIIVALKVNNDLERIGDQAVNIAERAAFLAMNEPLLVALDFPKMAEEVQTMVRQSLDALVKRDTGIAREVLGKDDEIDARNRQVHVILQGLMKNDPNSVERAVQWLSASRYLERIADLSTNIAQDVVFMTDGELIRHRVKDYDKRVG